MQFAQLIFLDLELTHEVKHSPRMSWLNIDSLKDFGEEKIASFIVVALEDQSSHQINEEACNGIGISNQI